MNIIIQIEKKKILEVNSMELDVYTIDNKNYLLIDKIYNYLYLSNEENEEDTLILKEDVNNKLLPLDNDEELKNALSLFLTKEVEENN